MSDQRLHYSLVRNQIEILFESEFIHVSSDFVKNFLNILSRLCNYEEEGNKIRPRIIVSKNIKGATKTVANSYLIKTKIGNIDGSDMEKIMKSLIPFCNNGWHVYIDIHETEIQYGVVRSFSGPIGLSISDNLFDIEDIQLVDYSVLEVKAINSFELSICGLRKNKLLIDSRYLENEGNNTSIVPRMIEDIISGVEEVEHKKILEKALDNLFRVIPYKIHGTICLIVEYDYMRTEFLKDGIWFDEPIDLGSKVIDSIVNNKDIVSAEAYYGLSGLFLEMLNVDGITVLDNKARVRGFNVFVKKAPGGVDIPNEGGARKRAAYTTLLSGEPKILGVYFLSQDGNSFYKRVGETVVQ